MMERISSFRVLANGDNQILFMPRLNKERMGTKKLSCSYCCRIV